MRTLSSPRFWWFVVAALRALEAVCAAGAPVVNFSPHGGCTAAIVTAVGEAKSTILVQAYSFTSEPIAAALVDAKARGVTVMVLLDSRESVSDACQAPALLAARCQVLYDDAHPIAHNKIMVIDDRTVLTGSFNYSAQAEENAENLLRIDSEKLAAKYVANWKAHQDHSTSTNPRAK